MVPIFKDGIWKLEALSDSDFANDKYTRYSVYGYIIYFCSVPEAWKSKSMLLCSLLVKELLHYMYLSKRMSTFTKLSKGALSSRWLLHPVSQGTSDPTITHLFTYTLVGQPRIHRRDHIPVFFCPYMLLSSSMDLSKCESTFLI